MIVKGKFYHEDWYYNGSFKDEKFHGKGTYHLRSNGTKIGEGNFKNGKDHGT